jgi:MFS family permease
LLTAGELGASAAQTTIVAVLPLLLRRYAASNFWIGFAVGGEGIFALLLPFWIGVASDRMPAGLARRFGRRMLPLLVAAPAMTIGVAAAPFARNYWLMAGAGFLFFAALHSYLTPLWALMLDSVPDERRARVQGTRGLLRALGLAYGLVGAGLLFSVSPTMPFLIAAALVVVSTAATWFADAKIGADRSPTHAAHRSVRVTWRELRHKAGAPWLLLANALWNAGIDGVRPYVFLYASVVMGLSVVQTSLGLGLLIAGIAIGSVIVGRLGDSLPRGRLLQIGTGILVLAFAVALFVGTYLRKVAWAAGAVALGGLGAATVVTVGYPYFAELVGEERQGQYTGLWVFSVGFGRIVSPMLVGVAIDLGARVMPRLQGYPLMWAAAVLFAIAGWFALWRAIRTAARHGHRDRAADERAA